jgi:C-terminal processing protease CtpA/Prc
VAVFAGCGGSGLSDGLKNAIPIQAPLGCDLTTQKSALLDYMQTGYLWSDVSPQPGPENYGTLEQYFAALLFTGSATQPADRWSYLSDSVQYNQFFQDGQTLGYGIFVNGLEGQLPLRIRYIEPRSPAALQGLQRGDVIQAINGVDTATLLASGNFTALSPQNEGDIVGLQIATDAGVRNVAVSASTYDLQPVAAHAVFTATDGRKAGYVSLKDFITQAEQPLEAAMGAIRAEGASDIIVDLRYNGGGRISTAAKLASLIAGKAHDGKVFVRLEHNAKVRLLDSEYNFSATASGFTRAIILTGSRTCSASELLVNGLKPYMEVVTIGGQTCGKPFGFQPVDSCGKTISAVNFESFNALGEGRYYQGLTPGCSVKENFTGRLGDPQETLTAAALERLHTGQCPAIATAPRMLMQVPGVKRWMPEPGEFRGMRAD